MRAALISLGSQSSVMTYEAMKKYFSEVDFLQLRHLEVQLGKESGIFYEGAPLGDYDCIYLKGSFRYANLLRSLAFLLEKKVPYMPLSPSSFTTVHNKLLTHLVLQQRNVPMPKTYVTSNVANAKSLLKTITYPIVMKFPEGTQGKGVMFADSFSSASSLLDALGALKQPFIIQEYVETGSTDIRALVVGDQVVGAMRRVAERNEKRANIHIGGHGEPVQLSREAVNLAIETSKALGAAICGVDILEGPTGPLVIEANISPGLQGLSKVCPVDIADAIAQFLFNRTQETVRKNKEQAAADLMRDLSLAKQENQSSQEILTPLQFRGEKILLPEYVTKMTKFTDRKEYVIKMEKGKLEIKEPSS